MDAQAYWLECKTQTHSLSCPPPFRYYTLDLKRQFYEKEMENSIQSRIHSFKNSINNIKGLSCALHRATIIRVCCV